MEKSKQKKFFIQHLCEGRGTLKPELKREKKTTKKLKTDKQYNEKTKEDENNLRNFDFILLSVSSCGREHAARSQICKIGKAVWNGD